MVKDLKAGYKVIHITGASGSGTTTVAGLLSEKYGYRQLDTDDYYWQPSDPPYQKSRTSTERLAAFNKDIKNQEYLVISGSLCGWGDSLIPLFDLVVYLDTATEIRISRLKKREYARFGQRICQGGDMYQEHQDFIDWAQTYEEPTLQHRSRLLHETWFKLLHCPLLVIDGSQDSNAILKTIEEFDSTA